jgi:hypothetical protein
MSILWCDRTGSFIDDGSSTYLGSFAAVCFGVSGFPYMIPIDELNSTIRLHAFYFQVRAY